MRLFKKPKIHLKTVTGNIICEVNMRVSKEEICAVRTAKNNITKHIYDIGDYKLSEMESKVVGRALKNYLQLLERTDKKFNETTI